MGSSARHARRRSTAALFLPFVLFLSALFWSFSAATDHWYPDFAAGKGIVAGSSQEPLKNSDSGGAEISIPFLGRVDTSHLSLPVLTVVIASLDSFNPCAFFVLFFLLSLLVHAHSRRKMLLIGGVFVLFSGLLYFLFMTAWLNLFLLFGNLKLITRVAGMVAIFIGAVNLKDFFFFKRGISLVISDTAKPKLFERMRGIMQAGTLPAMLGATVVLALAANSYEIICTAGFPMVYTRALTLHHLPLEVYYLYLGFYNLVYIVPLIIIVLFFVLTLGSHKLTEWQGRVLKLVSGTMMLCLGSVLMIRPALLMKTMTSVGLMLFSLIVAMIVAVTARFAGKGTNEG